MKKQIFFTLIFIMMLSLFSCNGDDTHLDFESNPVSDFEYSIDEERGAFIMNYVGTDKTVVIPSSIDAVPVTHIGYMSFASTDIESVVIPDSVHTIADYAFLGSKVRTVDFGEGVLKIQGSAFSGCSSLQKAILPPKLEFIGAESFAGCTALEEILIPKTLTVWESSITRGIFAECSALHKITIEDGLEVLGGAYGTFNQATSLKTLDIPASVKEIADFAFHGATSLESVTFLGDAPQVTEDVFGNSGEGSQTVSPHLIIYYDPNTAGWEDTPLRQYRLVPIGEN